MRGQANPHSTTGVERRTWFGHLMRLTLGPILIFGYYWMDLNGPNGRPEHGKVFSTVAFLWGIVALSTLAPWVAQLCDSGKPGCGASMTLFLGFAALVFAMAFSIEGFRIWSKYRASSDAALGQAAAAADQAIAARREQGGDFEMTE